MNKNLCLLISILLSGLCSKAQDFKFATDKYSEIVTSAAIASSAGFPYTMPETISDKWTQMSGSPAVVGTLYNYKSVEDIVHIGIKHDTALIRAAYKYQINLSLYCKDYRTLAVTVKSITLEISYNPDSLKRYTDLAMYRDTGYHSFHVTVNSINDITSGSPVSLSAAAIARNFYIQSEIHVQRYDLTPQAIASKSTYIPANKALEIEWALFNASGSVPCPLTGTGNDFKPVTFELEWCYIDDYQYNIATATSSYAFASMADINYDFRKNSTRVQITKGNTYQIPLIYEHGAILYRLRTLRPDASKYKDLIYGDWTIGDYGTIDPSNACFAAKGYLINEAHLSDSLNWQYTINFAEEGKYKHVINYFDGSLKDRQTQTKINSDNNYTIAVDKVYDYEGRPAIVSLPTPIYGQNKLQYTANILTHANTGNPYRAQDFDILGCSRPDSIAPLSTAAKANIYYSSLNPDQAGMQQYVPDAQGYPIVQTLYSPDNTNKVLWQGGAGQQQQIWKGHATQYQYTRATQEELDRFVGTEVGYHQFYPKQIVTDPNGQSSYSILDPSGKVIISGLQGPNPDTAKTPIDTLKNFLRGRVECSNLLADYTQTKTANALSAQLPIFNDVLGDASFKYSVKTFPFYTACGNQYLWAQGNYSMQVTNDCGSTMTLRADTVGQTKVTTANGAAYALTNPTVTGMPAGNYMVTKKIAFSAYDIHHLVDSFVLANEPTCYNDVYYFVRKAIDSTKFPCEGFIDTSSSHCDIMKKIMIKEMSPGGKYAGYTKDSLGNFLAGDSNSIFYRKVKYPAGTGIGLVTDYKYIARTGFEGPGFSTVITMGALDTNWECSFDTANYLPTYAYIDNYSSHPEFANDISPSSSGFTGDPTPFIKFLPVRNARYGSIVNIPTSTSLDEVYAYVSSDDSIVSYKVNGIEQLPFSSPGGGEKYHVTGFHYGFNEIYIEATTSDGGSNMWTKIIAYDPFYNYAYRDSCINLPDSVIKDGVVYKDLKNLPVETFIEIFNDEIAEALLPLHPEYCKLQNCNDGNFEQLLDETNTFQMAQENNMFLLDSLIIHDPLIYLAGGPTTALRLRTMSNGMPVDTVALQRAYCGAGNGEEYAYCLAKNYQYEIDNFIFLNDEIKQDYFTNLKALYIGNRSLIQQGKLDSTLNTCGTCNLTRLAVTGIPVFPSLDKAIAAGSGSSGDPDDNEYPEWMKELFRKGKDGDTTGMTTVPSSLSDTVKAINASFARAQAQNMLNHLKNCTLSETLRTTMYNAAINVMSTGLELSPDIVKSIIVDTAGLALSDLCHPFLVAYQLLPDTRPFTVAYACGADQLYADFLGLMQSTEVINELKAASTSTSSGTAITYNASNSFHQLFSSGTNITVKTYMDGVSSVCSTCFVNLIVSSNLKTDTFHITPQNFLSQSNIKDLLNSSSPVHTLSGMRCINEDPKAMATGYIAQNTAVLDASCGGSCIGTQSYYIWSGSTPLMNNAPAAAMLKEAVTCIDIKNSLQDFKTDKSTYGYNEATNHPLYAYTIANYLNYKLHKNYTFGEYENLMEGCASTDRVALKKLITTYRIELNSDADATSFITALYSYGNFKPDYFQYKVSGGRPVLFVDFNSVAQDTILAYKNFIDAYNPAVVVSRNYNYNPADDNTTLLFSTSDCSFDPADYATVYSTQAVSVLENGSYNANYKMHSFRIATTATPIQEAKLIADVNQFLHQTTLSTSPTCNVGYHFKGRTLLRSADYNTTLKQQYLGYIYGLSVTSHDAVIAAISPDVLAANLSSFATAHFTYDDPYCVGSRTHLYAYNPKPSPFPLAGTLAKNEIIQHITSQPFPNQDFTYVSGTDNNLAIIRKANGAYWYRYFDTGNLLHNLYIIPPNRQLGHKLEDYSLLLDSFKLGPHPRTFTIQANYGTEKIQCTGYADFELSDQSIIAENVILDKSATGVLCLDSFDCEYDLLSRATLNGKARYYQYFDSTVNQISNDMMTHLLNTTKDTLIFCGQKQQYQQTLYYYDLAGNLIETVPPAGIDTLAPASLAGVASDRRGTTAAAIKHTDHQKESIYRYNSLNQLVYQKTPDGATTYFFYDAAGRQIFSQNSKQRPLGFYSYSLYDQLGRPLESGEAQLGCASSAAVEFDTSYCLYYTHAGMPVFSAHPDFVSYAYDEHTYSYAELATYVRAKPRQDVVLTTYDAATEDLAALSGEMLSTQENLRSRVAAIQYYKALSTPVISGDPGFATYYSYDISGNVKTISYNCPKMKDFDQQYKRVDYDYDLISGKVNMISYNRGHPDQFYQQYDYDADNRITQVNTSNDGLIWNQDAQYQYYKHGPLAKLQIGNQKIQSLEYAYTIQGWLKAINGDVLNPAHDMGSNGLSGDITYARDVVAHGLHYFNQDYQSIAASNVVQLPHTAKQLFNGNIAQQTTGIGSLGTMQRTYQYDQLQRLVKASNQMANDASATLVSTSPANLFKSTYSYDKDGNIKTLQRWNGAASPVQIDNFSYNYEAGNNNNKLLQVADPGTPTGGNDLQPGQTANNYTYDKIGNLVADLQAGELITWDRMGKVTSINDSNAHRSITFAYDGKGNRIWKEVVSPGTTGEDHSGEYYVRDAGGNILTVYRTHSIYSAAAFTTSITGIASGTPSPFHPGGTVLTEVLRDLGSTTYPTGLKSTILTGHSSWLSSYTNKPVSFFMATDPSLKSSLIYSGVNWIDALRSANATIYRDALLAAGAAAQPMFTSALSYTTEGSKLLELYSKNMSAFVCEPIWKTAGISYSAGDASSIYSSLTGTAVSGTGNVLYSALATLSATSYPTALRSLINSSHTAWISTYTNRPISYYISIDGSLRGNLLNSGDNWINGLQVADPNVHRDAFLNAGMQLQPVFLTALDFQTEGVNLLEHYSMEMPQANCQQIWGMVQAQYMPGNHNANANNLYNQLAMMPQQKSMISDQLVQNIIQVNDQQQPEAGNFYSAFIADNSLFQSVQLRTQAQGGILTQTIHDVINNFGNTASIDNFFDNWSGTAAALSACTPADYKINTLYANNTSLVLDDMSKEASRSEVAGLLTGMSDLSTVGFANKLISAGASATLVHNAFPAPGAASPAVYTGNASNLLNGLNAHPQYKSSVVTQLVSNLQTTGGSSFYTEMVANNTLWQSTALRGSNGPWTTSIRDITYNYANATAFVSFFDAWSGAAAALSACTTPQYRLDAVYAAAPGQSIVDMSTEIGDAAVATLITAMPDMSIYSFSGKLVAAGLDEATTKAELAKATNGDTISLAEHHIYGSSRLGVQRYDTVSLANVLRPRDAAERRSLKLRTPWYSYPFDGLIDSTARTETTATTVNTFMGRMYINRTLGRRYYEMTDHLGNVLATVLDRKTGSGTAAGSSGTLYDHWSADLASTTDYYPGGMMMPGRNTEHSWSRMGAQGQQKDDEVYGKGNTYAFNFRMEDARIIRFFSPDPLHGKYPHNSDYAFSENDFISSVELEGLEKIYYHTAQRKKYSGLDLAIKVLNKSGIIQEVQSEFEAGNNKTDIHIVVEKLQKNQSGGTEVFQLYNNTAGAKQLVLEDIRNTSLPSADLKPIATSTLKDNKSPIIVRVSEDDVIEAGNSDEGLAYLTFVIAHETRAHSLNDKTGVDTKKQNAEHREYYNDKTLKGDNSTPYNQIRKDSPAGRDKSKIQKAVKELKSKS